jgi:galactitol-specific phosphotransferase system IIC component
MNTQQKNILVGTILGAGLGALAGYLFSREMEAPRSKGAVREAPPASEIVKLIIAVIAVLRSIAEMGERM